MLSQDETPMRRFGQVTNRGGLERYQRAVRAVNNPPMAE
jgi:hypothetical protein